MKYLIRLIYSLLLAFTASAPLLGFRMLGWISLIPFILISVFPAFYTRRLPTFRLRMAADGCELLILFLASTVTTTAVAIFTGIHQLPEHWLAWVLAALSAILAEAAVFWNGIIRVYATSVQLGIRWRVVGIVCGWIPIAHLYVLIRIILIVQKEVRFEADKIALDNARRPEQLCATRYPLLLVHGVFFRDSRHINYWGRIPAALSANGATIYYGNHQSASSVAGSATELARRIQEIVDTTGCGKVNIIAHSKGGLDCRYAIIRLGMANMVASLTTINTPHRGCLFADYLLQKCPESTKQFVARRYNGALRLIGDQNPDFLAAVTDLTSTACQRLDTDLKGAPEVYTHSVGSRLNHAMGGRFPLNFSYSLAGHFDGPNDGLVSVDSSRWGDNYTFLSVRGKRGISHADMIDLNRENIQDFDVREFYVNLVHDLKARGL